LKILLAILTFAPLLFGQWMIVKDDGTLEAYNNQNENSYNIPSQNRYDEKELSKTITIHKRHRKRAKKRVIITDGSRKKIAYLTFDDGPLNGTQNVINILSDNRIDATMFMIGRHVEQNRYRKKLFQMAIDEPNILVANHTYSHANGHYSRFYSDKNRVIHDLQKMERKISIHDPLHSKKCCRLAGRNVFRLPFIRRDDPAIKKKREQTCYDALANRGFKIFGWDYQWDYNPRNGKLYKSPQEIVRIMDRLIQRGRTRKPNKLILLMHDFTFKSRFGGDEKLRKLIALLKKDKWRFEDLESY